MKRQVTSPVVSPPAGVFSQAIEARPESGAFVFLSGMTSRNRDGSLYGSGDIQAQTRRCLDNMKDILSQTDSTLDDVIALTVYVTDIANLDAVHEVRATYFEPPYPSSTLVEVSSLVDPGMMIELTAIAISHSGAL